MSGLDRNIDAHRNFRDMSGLQHAEVCIPVQIVMDRHGDSRYFFETSDARSLKDAQARFHRYIHDGFRAVVPGKRGEPSRLLKNFEAGAEETLFIPPLEGG
jgi:hypothetical protein